MVSEQVSWFVWFRLRGEISSNSGISGEISPGRGFALWELGPEGFRSGLGGAGLGCFLGSFPRAFSLRMLPFVDS